LAAQLYVVPADAMASAEGASLAGASWTVPVTIAELNPVMLVPAEVPISPTMTEAPELVTVVAAMAAKFAASPAAVQVTANEVFGSASARTTKRAIQRGRIVKEVEAMLPKLC